MGASTYRSSSYSGKGSTTVSRSENITRKTSQERTKSPAREMLRLLEEVEKCREVVTSKQADLDSAKRDLKKAEQKALEQVNKLDPQTKARFKSILGVVEEKEQDDFER